MPPERDTTAIVTTAIHATAVADCDRGILICGPSRAGKSRLAVALVDRGTPARPITHIGDDRILIAFENGRFVLSPHPAIAGFVERRGLGIVAVPFRRRVPLHAVFELAGADPCATARAVLPQNLSCPRLVISSESTKDPTTVLCWLDGLRDEAQEAQCPRKARGTG